MRIMHKLVTALRGGIRETAEVVIDANDLRIFAQEIYECENSISQSKQQLASIMAEKMRVHREIKAIQDSIEKYEERIVNLLETDEKEALNIAELVSEKEAYLDRHQKNYHTLKSHEEKLQYTLKKMVGRLETYQAELRMAKATSKMQTVQSKLNNSNISTVTRFSDMQDSLSRIQERQQIFADEMDAMDKIDAHLSGQQSDLDEIKLSAKEVLDRIKKRKS